MTNAGTIASIIFVLGALVLAIRSLQGHQISFETKAKMAAAWVVIILVLVFLLNRFAL